MDAVWAVVVVASLYLAFKNVGWWRWFWLAEAALVGGFEGVSVLVLHISISQQFGIYGASHPLYAAFLCVLIAAGGIGLAWHLWTMVRKYQKKLKP